MLLNSHLISIMLVVGVKSAIQAFKKIISWITSIVLNY